jgi:superfamily I DNA and RNA helicase
METRHIKLDFEEALNAKKQLLSIELNILHTIKKVKSYKLLRKKEIASKNNLKSSIKSLNSRINLMLSSFPNEDGKPKTSRKRKKKKNEKEKQNIKRELEDIKEKLSKLK